MLLTSTQHRRHIELCNCYANSNLSMIMQINCEKNSTPKQNFVFDLLPLLVRANANKLCSREQLVRSKIITTMTIMIILIIIIIIKIITKSVHNRVMSSNEALITQSFAWEPQKFRLLCLVCVYVY